MKTIYQLENKSGIKTIGDLISCLSCVPNKDADVNILITNNGADCQRVDAKLFDITVEERHDEDNMVVIMANR